MAKKTRKRRKQLEPLEAIKRLLILSLARQGASSDEVGRVLEIDSSTIRAIVPFRTKKQKRN
jgi:hypothetical protein